LARYHTYITPPFAAKQYSADAGLAVGFGNKLLRDNTESVVTRLDGWISTSFIAANDQCHVVIYSQWRDLASVEAMRANPDMATYFPRIAALAALDSFAGDVVYNHHA
jgi:Antibiotic biosynthesis monooxygenase